MKNKLSINILNLIIVILGMTGNGPIQSAYAAMEAVPNSEVEKQAVLNRLLGAILPSYLPKEILERSPELATAKGIKGFAEEIKKIFEGVSVEQILANEQFVNRVFPKIPPYYKLGLVEAFARTSERQRDEILTLLQSHATRLEILSMFERFQLMASLCEQSNAAIREELITKAIIHYACQRLNETFNQQNEVVGDILRNIQQDRLTSDLIKSVNNFFHAAKLTKLPLLYKLEILRTFGNVPQERLANFRGIVEQYFDGSVHPYDLLTITKALAQMPQNLLLPEFMDEVIEIATKLDVLQVDVIRLLEGLTPVQFEDAKCVLSRLHSHLLYLPYAKKIELLATIPAMIAAGRTSGEITQTINAQAPYLLKRALQYRWSNDGAFSKMQILKRLTANMPSRNAEQVNAFFANIPSDRLTGNLEAMVSRLNGQGNAETIKVLGSIPTAQLPTFEAMVNRLNGKGDAKDKQRIIKALGNIVPDLWTAFETLIDRLNSQGNAEIIDRLGRVPPDQWRDFEATVDRLGGRDNPMIIYCLASLHPSKCTQGFIDMFNRLKGQGLNSQVIEIFENLGNIPEHQWEAFVTLENRLCSGMSLPDELEIAFLLAGLQEYQQNTIRTALTDEGIQVLQRYITRSERTRIVRRLCNLSNPITLGQLIAKTLKVEGQGVERGSGGDNDAFGIHDASNRLVVVAGVEGSPNAIALQQNKAVMQQLLVRLENQSVPLIDQDTAITEISALAVAKKPGEADTVTRAVRTGGTDREQHTLSIVYTFLKTLPADKLDVWLTSYLTESLESYLNREERASCSKGMEERVITCLRDIGDEGLNRLFSQGEVKGLTKAFWAGLNLSKPKRAASVAKELIARGITARSTPDQAAKVYGQYIEYQLRSLGGNPADEDEKKRIKTSVEDMEEDDFKDCILPYLLGGEGAARKAAAEQQYEQKEELEYKNELEHKNDDEFGASAVSAGG